MNFSSNRERRSTGICCRWWGLKINLSL